MRRVSVTCLSIFVSQYIDEDKNAVMVVSGSYGEEEDKSGPSRKLRLYGAFFEPLAEKLNLRVLHIPEMNAFMLMDRRADMPDEQIKNNYAEFKKRQNGGL